MAALRGEGSRLSLRCAGETAAQRSWRPRGEEAVSHNPDCEMGTGIGHLL